eukprot:scaffold361_cov248-Pinguiococcus_pyrenoidosus.AAC.22
MEYWLIFVSPKSPTSICSSSSASLALSPKAAVEPNVSTGGGPYASRASNPGAPCSTEASQSGWVKPPGDADHEGGSKDRPWVARRWLQSRASRVYVSLDMNSHSSVKDRVPSSLPSTTFGKPSKSRMTAEACQTRSSPTIPTYPSSIVGRRSVSHSVP